MRSTWKRALQSLEDLLETQRHLQSETHPLNKQIAYVVMTDVTKYSRQLRLDIFARDMRLSGDYGPWKPAAFSLEEMGQLVSATDRTLLQLLAGSKPREGSMWQQTREKHGSFALSPDAFDVVLPLLSQTEQLYVRRSAKEDPTQFRPLRFEGQTTWRFSLSMIPQEGEGWACRGEFFTDQRRVSLESFQMILSSGLILLDDILYRCEVSESEFEWVYHMRHTGAWNVPSSEEAAWLHAYWSLPKPPYLRLPKDLQWDTRVLAPEPQLILEKDNWFSQDIFRGKLQCVYPNKVFGPQTGDAYWPDPPNKQLLQRDLACEEKLIRDLTDLGLSYYRKTYDALWVQFPLQHLAQVVSCIEGYGGRVAIEKQRLRRDVNAAFSLKPARQGFDLLPVVKVDGQEVPFPAILKALEKQVPLLELGSGDQALLPQEFLQRMQEMAQVGEAHGEGYHFHQQQVTVLGALLGDPTEAERDQEAWKGLRRSLRALDPPDQSISSVEGFHGELRPYQCEGLTWLSHLTGQGYGVCLADDMGLGKTIQVLAYLQMLRTQAVRDPALIVVPRSLLHNWVEEAKLFTPGLRFRMYTGKDRAKSIDDSDYDILITTYGLMRLDIETLEKKHWGVIVLDEAQSIKTSRSLTTKAARRLSGMYRIALSGTPVENHMGEIASIFEFLNPHMFGSSKQGFAKLLRSPNALNQDQVDRVAQALRPFILRRKKSDVLSDLPPKVEQVLFCDMEDSQMQTYQELAAYYRQRVEVALRDRGLEKSKIHVLEALLRLRQAACHPGLIDPARRDEMSPKLEALLEHLTDLHESGNKALVFSQFTKHLAIVRNLLDQQGLKYAYLDGRTVNRQEVVQQFQEDPECKIFLISLKAGGLGLNLTAAEYCFLLDPWWNPAAEAQAIDRAHRIGQTKSVFAYRLITKGTIEERILELQKHKQALADRILTSEVSVLRSLSVEELRSLFAP